MTHLKNLSGLGVLDTEEINNIEKIVGGTKKIIENNKGLVHHIYKIVGANRSIYLKIRGNTFSKLPNINTNPGLIINEYKAINIFGALFPSTFPTILYLNKKKGILALSDISAGLSEVDKLLSTGKLTEREYLLLGKTVGHIHNITTNVRDEIRTEGDTGFKSRQLFYLLGFLNHPSLNQAIKQHETAPTNLLLGDPSPKNLYIGRDRVTICDLEHSHQGSRVFEQAHLVAHIILHRLSDPGMDKWVQSFLDGYAESGLPIQLDKLFRTTVLGIILYRLASPVIPYNLKMSLRQRRSAISFFTKLLDYQVTNFWETLSQIKKLQLSP